MYKHDHYQFNKEEDENQIMTNKQLLTINDEKAKPQSQQKSLPEKANEVLVNQFECDECSDLNERLIKIEETDLVECKNIKVNERENVDNFEEIEFNIEKKLLEKQETYVYKNGNEKENCFDLSTNINVTTNNINKSVCLDNKFNSSYKKNGFF